MLWAATWGCGCGCGCGFNTKLLILFVFVFLFFSLYKLKVKKYNVILIKKRGNQTSNILWSQITKLRKSLDNNLLVGPKMQSLDLRMGMRDNDPLNAKQGYELDIFLCKTNKELCRRLRRKFLRRLSKIFVEKILIKRYMVLKSNELHTLDFVHVSSIHDRYICIFNLNSFLVYIY